MAGHQGNRGKRSVAQAVQAWGVLNATRGDLCGLAGTKAEAREFASGPLATASAIVVPVRIIRECDYRRLLRGAK